MKYQRRSEFVDAIQWTSEENKDRIREWLGDNLFLDFCYRVRTYGGTIDLYNGDYVIQDEDGDFDVYGRDFFEINFTPVEDASDGYHTYKELYEFIKIYNAAFFNELAKQGKYEVVKSKKHSDGKECFDGGWFIVMAQLPSGQISNHYELKDWDLFQCKEVVIAPEWDGHTSADVIERLKEYIIYKS